MRGQRPPLKRGGKRHRSCSKPGSRATAGARHALYRGRLYVNMATRRGARATSVGAFTHGKRIISEVANTEEAQGVVPLVYRETFGKHVRCLIVGVYVLDRKGVVIEEFLD